MKSLLSLSVSAALFPSCRPSAQRHPNPNSAPTITAHPHVAVFDTGTDTTQEDLTVIPFQLRQKSVGVMDDR